MMGRHPCAPHRPKGGNGDRPIGRASLQCENGFRFRLIRFRVFSNAIRGAITFIFHAVVIQFLCRPTLPPGQPRSRLFGLNIEDRLEVYHIVLLERSRQSLQLRRRKHACHLTDRSWPSLRAYEREERAPGNDPDKKLPDHIACPVSIRDEFHQQFDLIVGGRELK